MRPFHAAPSLAASLAKPRAQVRPTSRFADAKDFTLLAVFVFAFMAAGYLALWKPLLARLS